MSINSSRLFQLFKYAVYALLTFNIFLFWQQEHLAAQLQYASGMAMADIISAYSATIDTVAWVILLLMFELETYVLEDDQFSPGVNVGLQAVRVLCYLFIIYAFYGYVANYVQVAQTTLLSDVSSLCALVGDGWSYAGGLDDYTLLTLENCHTLSDATSFYQYDGIAAVVDAAGRQSIHYLALLDVVNAAVWLLVVLVLEIDVRLQERNRFEGLALKLSNAVKFVLYSLLFLAAVYWGFNGDFVDFWDAFLWLVAFVLIELNVFEWRQESHLAAEESSA